MRFLESDKQGSQHFTFEHSSSYQMVQKRFYGAVESMNPDFIVVSVKLWPLNLLVGRRYFHSFIFKF